MCSPTRQTHPTWKTHIPSDMCSLPEKHISLVICVPPPGKHVSQVICVPLGVKPISSDMCSSPCKTHILHICSRTWETHIPSNMYSPTWETHIPSGMCSPTRQARTPNDMCSPSCETHFSSDSLPGKHISLVICVPYLEIHIPSDIPSEHISLVICVPYLGNTYP